MQINPRQHLAAVVRESYPAKLDLPARGRKSLSTGRVDDPRPLHENLIQTLHRREPALHEVDNPPQGDHRPGQLAQVTDELHKLTERDAAGDHRLSTLPQQHHSRQTEEERHQWPQRAVRLDHRQVPPDVLAVQDGKRLGFMWLQR